MNTIAEQWADYEAKVIGKSAGATQRSETKIAFYGGASAILNILCLLDSSSMSEEDGVAVLTRLNAELRDFPRHHFSPSEAAQKRAGPKPAPASAQGGHFANTAMDCGNTVALKIIPNLSLAAATADKPEAFYAGFFGTLFGAMSAQIGSHAALIVIDVAREALVHVGQEHGSASTH